MNTSVVRYFGGCATAAVLVVLALRYPLARGPIDTGVGVSATLLVACGLIIAYGGFRGLLNQRGESAADAPSAESFSDR